MKKLTNCFLFFSLLCASNLCSAQQKDSALSHENKVDSALSELKNLPSKYDSVANKKANTAKDQLKKRLLKYREESKDLKAILQGKDSSLLKSLDSATVFKKPALFSKDSLAKKGTTTLKNLFTSKINKNILPPSPLTSFKKPLADSITKSLYKKILPGKPFIVIKNGLVNYNYTYRSGLDTPYLESNLQQHLANISANVLVAQKFPLRVSVFERRSNSVYFRNYTDVRVEFNAPEFRRLQAERMEKYFNALIGQLLDPNLKPGMYLQQKIISNLTGYLNSPAIIKKFLQSKETIINKNELSGTPAYKDSLIRKDSAFIAYYDKKQKEVKKAEQDYDSLRSQYVVASKKIQRLRQIFKRNINSPAGSETMVQSLREAGLHDRHFEKLIHTLYSVRTLTIGKTMPNYTNLTVKNVGINGINAEFNNKNLYWAVVAGIVDFRARDFIFNKYQSSHQYVTAVRVGWGRKEGNHIIFTAYKGQKQLFSSQVQNNVTPVFGLSVESQFVITRNIRLIAEVAQSSMAPSAGVLIDSVHKGFSLKDNNSKAWSFQLYSYFPHTRTRVDGLYEHQGINFQCFNAYKTNASTDAWSLKADQYLFSNILHLTAAIHKNDYSNPLIQQNYNSNTIFTTFTATFYKRFWPIVSVGYIPSSQYSIINNQVYESRYQAFNINVSHLYKLGTVNASTTAMYNRFYNDSRDSGFVYYNAHNLYVNQNILFTKFTANVSISHTQNPVYLLDVMEAGITRNIKKISSVGFGVKLDHLNSDENKLGYYVNAKATIAKVGVLNVWGETSYLPGIDNKLIKNEFMNIGFTRYFN